jgi:outer membrane receptor protein involved in Fe transport
MGGYRYDYSQQSILPTPADPEDTEIRKEPVDQQWTPQIGVSWRPFESGKWFDLNLYALYSESFFPQRMPGRELNPDYNPEYRNSSGQLVLVDSSRPLQQSATLASSRPPFTGTNKEIGAKLFFFDGRLTGTLSVFDIEFANQPFSLRVERPFFELTGDEPTIGVDAFGTEAVQGFEMEIVAQPIDPLQIFLGYSFIDGEVRVPEGLNIPNNGYDLPRAVPHSANLFLKWTMPKDSRFDGLSFGGGLQWDDRHLGGINYHENGDVQTEIYLDDRVQLDAFVGYNRTFGNGKYDITWRLNVRNVTNERDFTLVTSGDGSTSYARDPRRIVFSTEISWR